MDAFILLMGGRGLLLSPSPFSPDPDKGWRAAIIDVSIPKIPREKSHHQTENQEKGPLLSKKHGGESPFFSSLLSGHFTVKAKPGEKADFLAETQIRIP